MKPALLILLMLITGALLSSCQKEEKTLNPQEIKAKVDSIMTAKEKKLRLQAAEDLNRRLSIELKPKVDSILHRSIRPDSIETPMLDTSGQW